MSLYVVVNHQQDENQPRVNAWLNDQLIEAIQTTTEIGNLCRGAKERGERVRVHRCVWGQRLPTICCSAEVETVADLDKATAQVRFTKPTWINNVPPQSPTTDQNFYLA